MGTVDDPAVVSRIGICLGAKLKAEVFDDIYSGISFAASVGPRSTHEQVVDSENEPRC